MNITNQTNESECGVCVLTSLHNYFYPNKEITKEFLLNLSNIQQDGLSIFDFEILGKKANLNCETYQLDWDEFMHLKITKHFVLLLQTNSGNNHYVIAKKAHRNILIYDSVENSCKTFKYDQIKNIFLGIIILISKDNSSNIIFKKSLLTINTKYVVFSILIYTLTFILSILIGSMLNWLIDLAIVNKSVSNLVTICFSFVLVYLLNALCTYILNLYSSSQLKDNFILLTSQILQSLAFKMPTFSNKVDKIWIYKIDECVYNIALYSAIEINKFITNIISIVVCFCIIGMLNKWLLIFCLFYLLVEVVFFSFNYSKKKNLFIQMVKRENHNTLYYKTLIDNLQNEIWLANRLQTIQNIKLNYSDLYKNFHDVNLYRSNIKLIKSILVSIFDVISIGFISYLSIKNSISIGKITFIIASFDLFKSTLNNCLNFFLAKIEFNTYWQVYQDLIAVDNLKQNEKLNLIAIKDIKSMQFFCQNKNYILNTKQSISQIDERMTDIVKKSNEIQIDFNKYSLNDLNIAKTLIVVDEFISSNRQFLIDKFNTNSDLYGKYIRYFNIDLNQPQIDNISNLIINLLNLLDEKDKIIFIDSVSYLINEKNKLIYKDLLNKISKNNLIFIVERSKYD